MRKLLLVGISSLAAFSLAACNDEEKSIENNTEKVDEAVLEDNNTIGFVTYIQDGEYIEIEVDGVYLQYAVDTTGIQIGNRVVITFEGNIEDKKIKNIEIDRKEVVELEEQNQATSKEKEVTYIDKNGNVINNLEEFKENIKKNKEEAEAAELARIAELDAQMKKAEEEAVLKAQQEAQQNQESVDVTPSTQTTPEETTKNTNVTQIMYYGKADSRTIEVLHEGTMKAMYLASETVSKQFDSINLEAQLNVEVSVDANGNYVINSIK